MSDVEVTVAVTVAIKNGARHATIQWLPGDEAAMELAIGVACVKAAAGYKFQGIRPGESVEQRLWLVQRPEDARR